MVAGVMILALLTPFNIFSESLAFDSVAAPVPLPPLPDTIPLSRPVDLPAEVVESEISTAGDSVTVHPVDSVAVLEEPSMAAMQLASDDFRDGGDEYGDEHVRVFNPDPNRAVWLSALFPGLGQIYNRRYWKLPLVVGGFMALGYGTSWNNGMLRDYTRAYSDLLDNDPTTKSYMDFFPPTTQESQLDKQWLQRLLKSRKDFYRRNRDLCIISMVGVYLLAMVDAYVDASLAHFDISPDLSMTIQPAVIPDTRSRIPGLGLQWAFNF